MQGFSASLRIWEWGTADIEQKLKRHLTFILGLNWVRCTQVVSCASNIRLKKENEFFKPMSFLVVEWRKPRFTGVKPLLAFSSFLKSCREHSLFQSFLPPAKILSDKECGTIAVTYFYNDHQSKRMSCLDLFFLLGSFCYCNWEQPQKQPLHRP